MIKSMLIREKWYDSRPKLSKIHIHIASTSVTFLKKIRTQKCKYSEQAMDDTLVLMTIIFLPFLLKTPAMQRLKYDIRICSPSSR